jgi:putative copper export protein
MFLGLVLVLAGSLGEVALISTRIARGRFDQGIFLDYLLSTRHGLGTFTRCGLAVVLAAWGGRTLVSRRTDRFLHATAGLGLLGTVAWTSHSGVMGLWPFLGDVAHLVAATSWGGAVLYLAWSALWTGSPTTLRETTRRVSAVGLTSVLLLTATGVYLGVVHLYGLRALTTTPYGTALRVKLTIIAVILAIAAFNRWRLVPLLERHGASAPLRRAVRVESVLLVAVLAATGVLTTREPPHEHAAHAHAEHAPHHEADDPGTPAVTSSPGTIEVVGERRYRLTLEPGADLEALRVLTPEGEVHPLDVPAAHDLSFTLPMEETGIWRLDGAMNGEPFSLPLALLRAATTTGQEVYVHLTPAPSLSGGGTTELTVATRAARAEPLVVSYHMPGMQHATDDEPVTLIQTPGDLWHATLRFPMVGTWRLALHVGDERLELPVEVLDE